MSRWSTGSVRCKLRACRHSEAPDAVAVSGSWLRLPSRRSRRCRSQGAAPRSSDSRKAPSPLGKSGLSMRRRRHRTHALTTLRSNPHSKVWICRRPTTATRSLRTQPRATRNESPTASQRGSRAATSRSPRRLRNDAGTRSLPRWSGIPVQFRLRALMRVRALLTGFHLPVGSSQGGAFRCGAPRIIWTCQPDESMVRWWNQHNRTPLSV